MTIAMNFVVDFIKHLRSELVVAGFAEAADSSKVPDDEIGIRYFNVLIRVIEPRPRPVKFSKAYIVPAGQESLVKQLVEKIERGDDLRPYQSRKLVNKKLLANDGMLNDWGIHHLHSEPTGSAEVLMCHVKPTTLYAIGFWPHDKWTFKPIWDELIRSWPQDFKKYIVNGVVATPLTDEQRVNLRKKNASVMLDGPDGQTYTSIGGGLSAAGTNMGATIEYDRACYEVEQIEKCVQKQVTSLGIAGPTRVTLLFENGKPVAIFDETTKRRVELQPT